MVRDFYSAYKSYAYSNEHWTVAVNDEDGKAYTASYQGPLDSELQAHLLPEVVPESDMSSDEESVSESPIHSETASLHSVGRYRPRFLETQTSRLIDFLNFDLQVCLLAELKDEGTRNVVAFPDSNTDIGPSLSEILRELGTNLLRGSMNRVQKGHY